MRKREDGRLERATRWAAKDDHDNRNDMEDTKRVRAQRCIHLPDREVRRRTARPDCHLELVADHSVKAVVMKRESLTPTRIGRHEEDV